MVPYKPPSAIAWLILFHIRVSCCTTEIVSEWHFALRGDLKIQRLLFLISYYDVLNNNYETSERTTQERKHNRPDIDYSSSATVVSARHATMGVTSPNDGCEGD